MERLDLLLVNPANRRQAYGALGDELCGIEPAFWCGLLAGFIREQGYQVGIIDADAEGWTPEQTATNIAALEPLLVDIVVLGSNPSASSTPKMSGVRPLLNALKAQAPRIKVALSGLHPSALPEQTLREEKTDFVCQGEGFFTLLRLLEQLNTNSSAETFRIDGLWYAKGDSIISNPPAAVFADLDKLPFVAWDLLPMEKYRAHNWHCFADLEHRSPYAVIYTSLGCPFQCRYCPVQAFYGNSGIRYRRPERVVEEIDLLVRDYQVKNIKFMDELFGLQPDRVAQLCDLIVKRGYQLNIWAYARVDTVNAPLLKKMKQAGVNWICYGFESADESVRLSAGKHTPQEKINRTIELTKACGIHILANFIFGLPDDSRQTMRQTLDMAEKFNFEYVNFYVCMAYPGSPLYEEALKKRISLPQSWDGYGQYAYEALPLPTKYLRPEEVLAFRDQAFQEYFSKVEYLKMINEKFGPRVVGHIQEMLKRKIKRKLVDAERKI